MCRGSLCRQGGDCSFLPFSGVSDSFRVTPFRGGAISQNPALSLSLAMSSRVPMRRIFDLGPRCAEGACPHRVTTAAFCPFSGVSDNFRVNPFRGGAISQNPPVRFVLSYVLYGSNASDFRLRPSLCRGSLSRQGHDCSFSPDSGMRARAARARAYNFYLF